MSDADKNINKTETNANGSSPAAQPEKAKAENSEKENKKSKKALFIILPLAAVLLVTGIVLAVKLAGDKKKPGPVIVTDYNGVTVTDVQGEPGPVIVTDYNGVTVTDVQGEPVTVMPETEVVTVTDTNGEVQTTVVAKEVVVTVPLTDDAGKTVTDASGKDVTETVVFRPEIPTEKQTEKKTTQSGGNTPATTKKRGNEPAGDDTPETTQGVSVIGTTVVPMTDGQGNTGVDEHGEVITTVIPITSVPAIVEPAKTEWKFTQGGSVQDYFSDVILLDDGNYVTANVTNSKDGDFAKFKDLGYVIPYTVFTKYDADGNIIWQNAVGAKGIMVFTDLEPIPGGGFYAAGYGKNIGGEKTKGYYDAAVFKFDNDGNEVWHKTFGTSTVDLFNGIAVTSDGGVVAVGSVGNNDGDAKGFGLPSLNSAASAVKYSAKGDLVWKNVFGGNQDYLNDVAVGKNGIIYAVGTFYSGKLFDSKGKSDGGIVKFSEDGKVERTVPVAGTGIESFEGITVTSDGGIVIVGRSDSADLNDYTSFFCSDLSARGGFDAYIIKFTPDFTVRFAQTFRGQNDDRLSDVVEDEEGRLLAVGYTNSSSRDLKGVTTRGGDDMVVACFSKSGALLWARAFGGSKDDSADAICLGSDGGYVIAGKSLSRDVDLKGIAPYVNDKTVAAIVKFPE